MRKAALRELLDSFFDGSEAELLQYLKAQHQPQHVPEQASAVAAGAEAEPHIDTALL
jgi:hypothetical protein